MDTITEETILRTYGGSEDLSTCIPQFPNKRWPSVSWVRPPTSYVPSLLSTGFCPKSSFNPGFRVSGFLVSQIVFFRKDKEITFPDREPQSFRGEREYFRCLFCCTNLSFPSFHVGRRKDCGYAPSSSIKGRKHGSGKTFQGIRVHK